MELLKGKRLKSVILMRNSFLNVHLWAYKSFTALLFAICVFLGCSLEMECKPEDLWNNQMDTRFCNKIWTEIQKSSEDWSSAHYDKVNISTPMYMTQI